MSVTRAPRSSTRGRSIPVTGGSFNDAFADANAIHIYRIDGGSSRGLLASPSNDFSCRLKRNLSKGWARLAVRVPSAGELRLKKTRRVHCVEARQRGWQGVAQDQASRQGPAQARARPDRQGAGQRKRG